MTEKIFEGYLLLHWKTGKFSIKKRKPKTGFPYEIPVKFEIKVELPEPKQMLMKGEITLPQPQARAIVAEEI